MSYGDGMVPRGPLPLKVAVVAWLVCGCFPSFDGFAASGDADASTSSGDFCRGTSHAFCCDFDGTDPLAAWTDREVASPDVLEVSTDYAVSRPAALLSHMARRSAQAPHRYAILRKTFPGGWRRAIVEFDFRFSSGAEQLDDHALGFLGVAYWSDGDWQGTNLSVGPNSSTLAGWGNRGDPPGAGRTGLAHEQWHHGRLEITPGTRVTATVGPMSYSVDLPSVSAGPNPRVALTVGVHGFNEPSADYTFLIDNVTVDFP